MRQIRIRQQEPGYYQVKVYLDGEIKYDIHDRITMDEVIALVRKLSDDVPRDS